MIMPQCLRPKPVLDLVPFIEHFAETDGIADEY